MFSPVAEGFNAYLFPNWVKTPALEWVEPLRLALSESYELHQLFLDWVEPDPSPLTVTATMNVAKEQFDRKEQELRFLIVRREDQELVGSISLHVRDVSVPYYELGYWVRQSAAGKGYITEAVLLLADYAFIHLHAARLEIRTAASNEKSGAVAERGWISIGGDFCRMPAVHKGIWMIC